MRLMVSLPRFAVIESSLLLSMLLVYKYRSFFLVQEGRILCMTTNHIEKLDPALIRPGRIVSSGNPFILFALFQLPLNSKDTKPIFHKDIRVLFTHASRVQARELFSRFYPTLDVSQLANEFASAIPVRME